MMVQSSPPVQQPLQRRRGHHDLEAIAALERARIGPHVADVVVAWGRDARAGQQLRSIRFGTFNARQRVARIHPRLDDARVPHWFVAFVVHHELLHAALGLQHSPAFRRAELAHPDARNAKVWSDARVNAVLSATWSPASTRR